MHPLDIFEGIYVINLPSRTDRRAEMAEQLGAIGLALDSPGVNLFPAVRPEDKGGFPTIGTRGCFLSHLGVLRDALSRGLNSVLILEDDLNFAPDFLARFPPVAEQLKQKDWSIFYGGHELFQPLAAEAGKPMAEAGPEVTIQTAHFIAFSGKAIGQTVDFLEAILSRPPGDPRGGPMHVDGAYNWYRRAYPEESVLLALPELGYQRKSRTDIHELRWFDKMPVVRAGVAGLRRLINKVN